MTKQYRLWIKPTGDPLYVECVGREPTQDMVRQVSAMIHEALAGPGPVILGPDWEIRVVSA